MLKYVAVNGAAFGEENGERHAVSGIAAYENGQLAACIEDITPDRAEAEQLAAMLNAFGASLLHFREIIEDYVAAR